MASSRNGKRLVFSDPSSRIRVWNLDNRQEIRSLQVGPFLSLISSLSPDGKLLAVGTDSEKQAVMLWDVERARLVTTFPLETHGLSPFFRRSTAAFSPDGQLLVRAGDGNKIKFWDVATRKDVAVLECHPGSFFAVNPNAFSPDGKLFATCGTGSPVRLWDLATKRALYEFPGYKNWSGPALFSPDGKVLATGTGDLNTIQIWDVATRRPVATLKGHTSQISHVDFSPDGKTLVTCGNDQTIRFWSTASWQDAIGTEGPTARSL